MVTMRISKTSDTNTHIKINGTVVREVEKFNYFGTDINSVKHINTFKICQTTEGIQ
jgi:hypothetical protein